MPHSVEGRRQGDWILLDYVDFVAHVFLTERRAFYDIERLRKSARPLTPAEFDAELKVGSRRKDARCTRQVRCRFQKGHKVRESLRKASTDKVGWKASCKSKNAKQEKPLRNSWHR